MPEATRPEATADAGDRQGRRVVAGSQLSHDVQIELEADDRVVLRSDALASLDWIAAHTEAPALVYLDPPFAVGKDFALLRDAGGGQAGDVAYSDRWPDLDAYLAWIEPVLRRVREVLADDGSLLLHCDHRASPYLAVLCDRIFGAGDRSTTRHAPGFRNELIWSYGLGGSSKRCYPKKHDTIFWYSKSERWYFEPPMVPATSQRLKGKLKKAPDVLDVPAINNMARERTGYPTQKPLALLELLVRAHTRPGELVVDVTCGSGTTGVAAVRCGRRCVVGDAGAQAVQVTRARLQCTE